MKASTYSPDLIGVLEGFVAQLTPVLEQAAEHTVLLMNGVWDESLVRQAEREIGHSLCDAMEVEIEKSAASAVAVDPILQVVYPGLIEAYRKRLGELEAGFANTDPRASA